MNPADLPLRDIHLPAPVGWWPLAPGWWVLLCLLVGGVVFLFWWWKRKKPTVNGLELALRTLDQLQGKYGKNTKALLRELSVLLRRVAISQYGRQQVSGLTGGAWLDFLDEKAGTNLFKGKFDSLLTELPYRAETQVETGALTQAIREWIKLQRRNTHV
jgi:hypothetical protein